MFYEKTKAMNRILQNALTQALYREARLRDLVNDQTFTINGKSFSMLGIRNLSITGDVTANWISDDIEKLTYHSQRRDLDAR